MRPIIFFSLLLFVNSSFCQIENELNTNSNTDDHIWNAFAYNNNYYLLMSSGIFNYDVYPDEYIVKGYNNYILKLDNYLNKIDSVFIDSISGFNTSYLFPNLLNDTLYLFGYAINENRTESQVVLLKYQLPNLTLVNTYILGEEVIKERVNDVIVEDDGTFTLSVNNMTDLNNRSQILMRTSNSGNISFYNNDTTIKLLFSTIYKMPSTDKYIINTSNKAIIFEPDLLNYSEEQTPNLKFRYTGKKEQLTDSKYIIGGNKYKPGSGGTYTDMYYYVSDENYDYIDSGFINLPDTNDIISCLNIIDTLNIIYGGTHNRNWSMQSPELFEEEYRWIVLKNENIVTKEENWIFLYGGDMNYILYGSLITEDESVVAYGTTYDWLNTEVWQRDVFVLKIDANGQLVSTENKITKPYVLVYPNPASNVVKINNNLKNGKYLISNINGLILKEKKINSSSEKLDISFLASGVYIISFFENNEFRFSQKFVKD